MMRLAVLALLMAIGASEAAALIRAERLRGQIPTLEMADVPRVRAQFDRIDLFMPIGLGSGRIASRLSARMVDLADQSILEFRMEAPALAQAQWLTARDCLELAVRLRPGDGRIASRWAYVRGQLARIAERDREAIRLFREAARLDPTSPDPYLGLASLHAYVTRDLAGLTEAIHEAERRGYTRSRREQVELGDLHKWRADQARVAAAALSGPARLEQLELAADDYRQCIRYFDGLRVFDSEAHLRDCRQRLADLTPQLPAPAPAPAPSGRATRTVIEI
jgi:tetratricopeptide (TPR) repeat protein